MPSGKTDPERAPTPMKLEKLEDYYKRGVPRKRAAEEVGLQYYYVQRLYDRWIGRDGDEVLAAKKCSCGLAFSHKGSCYKAPKPKEYVHKIRAGVAKQLEEGSECPCCGNLLVRERMYVDLNSNILSFQGRRWRLAPNLAVVAHMLIKEWPKGVSQLDMKSGLYGVLGDEKSDDVVRVYASHLRYILAPLGVRIETNNHGVTRLIFAHQAQDATRRAIGIEELPPEDASSTTQTVGTNGHGDSSMGSVRQNGPSLSNVPGRGNAPR